MVDVVVIIDILTKLYQSCNDDDGTAAADVDDDNDVENDSLDVPKCIHKLNYLIIFF